MSVPQIKMAAPRPDPHPPLYANTWHAYWESEYDFDTGMLTGHTDATHQQTDSLEQIVLTAKSYDELKSELLAFIKERGEFLKDVNEKWCGPDREKWGFPPSLD